MMGVVLHAFRQLRRAPMFAGVAIVTLAVAIGATTAVFTVVDRVLLRPSTFEPLQRLTLIVSSVGSRISPGYFDAWRRDAKGLTDIAAWYDSRESAIDRTEPFEVRVDRVTTNFFATVGVSPHLGRTFAGDNLQDPPRDAVLSYGFWQRRYGGDSRVIGRAVTLDGQALTIVGVMPQGFSLPTTELGESRADIWAPFRLVSDDLEGMGGNLHVIGRLAPGITVGQAGSELSLLSQQIEQRYPSYSRGWSVTVTQVHDAEARDVRVTLFAVFGAAALLLTLACVNVANLVMTRHAARQDEFAVRFALGAGRWRVARQLITEAAVIAGVSAALASVFAWSSTSALVAALPDGIRIPHADDIGVGLGTVGFVLIATFATMLLVGVLPSWQAIREAPSGLSRVGRQGQTARVNGLHGLLVVVQLALALEAIS